MTVTRLYFAAGLLGMLCPLSGNAGDWRSSGNVFCRFGCLVLFLGRYRRTAEKSVRGDRGIHYLLAGNSADRLWHSEPYRPRTALIERKGDLAIGPVAFDRAERSVAAAESNSGRQT